MFKVIANTGDIITKGTLLVYEDTKLSKDVIIIGLLNVGESKFIVYTDGSVEMQGDLKLNNTKFLVESISGNTTIEGILKILNDLNINNKFYVDHNTGDTQISGSVQIYENLNVNNILIVDNLNKSILIDGDINTLQNINILGNMNISGKVNFNSDLNIDDKFVVENSGNVLMTGELKVGNKILLSDNKFIVDTNGDISSNGKLSILDNFNVNIDKFYINSLNGDTYIDNNLTINNKLLINNINDIIYFNNNIININKQIDLDKSLNINIDKFQVDYDNGNVNIAGILDVFNNSLFHESIIINKNLSVGENLEINGHLSVKESLVIDNNAHIKQELLVDKLLKINDLFIINALTKQISFGISNPIYDIDLSGNMRIDNIMINKNIGFNGYLFEMTDIYDPSIKFKVVTSDNRVFKYESPIITLTNENYILVKSIIEFDINYYIPETNLRYIDLSFDLYINSNKHNDNGDGFTISLFNSISCENIPIDDLRYNIDLDGYTIYLNVLENSLQIYENELSKYQITMNNLINSDYHNYQIIITDNTIKIYVDNLEILTYPIIEKLGKYILLGGWTTTNTITQKVKNIKCYVEYDECKKKFQVYGETLMKKTTIDGNFKCLGNIQLDGPITTENNNFDILKRINLSNDLILSGNLINNGTIIDMNNIGDFYHQIYLIGNDYYYDINNNEIKLTENTLGSIQTIIEFNFNEYINDSIINEFIFEADFITLGRGIWFYFYNEEQYLNSYLAYTQEINGYCIFIDDNNNIYLYERANQKYNYIYTPNENWQKIFIQVNNNNLILKINDIEYINTYYNFIYKGNYFGIGALNGLQKVKNIKITSKINNSINKFCVFGNTIIKGNTKITGNTKYYNDVDINGSLTIKKGINVNDLLIIDNSINLNDNLNIKGNINFTGEIYHNGTMLDITIQNPLKWNVNEEGSYYTPLSIAIGKNIPFHKLDVSGGINCISGYYINDTQIIDDTGRITSNAYIPLLNASKIAFGIIDDSRIPELNVSKITTGVFVPERIPDLNASKITSGVFTIDKIPELDASLITTGKINNEILPSNIDISGSIKADTFINLPIIGNKILITTNPIIITNPFNSTNIYVTANLQSTISQNIIVQIGTITTNNIEFILNTNPLDNSFLNYIIFKK
jgi:cytoskeletal protein CcmA (bactofilin family)